MRLFRALVLRRPWLTLAAVLALTLALGRLVPRFGIDASSESLLLANDPSLVAYGRSHQVFGSDDYVMIGLTLDDPFTDENVRRIEDLAGRFLELEGVETVLSITEVPLLKSPPLKGGPLVAMLTLARAAQAQTQTLARLPRRAARDEIHRTSTYPVYLSSPRCDRARARAELLHHSIYRKNLISDDGRTISLLVYFKVDPDLIRLERDLFRWQEDLDALERRDVKTLHRLLELEGVENVAAITEVPLLKSPPLKGGPLVAMLTLARAAQAQTQTLARLPRRAARDEIHR
ncbi:MAG: hypothetical protein HZA54_07750, partial [Planctomycetes bacterium]|nr:hypothetical protein [Planctomycetota bacterium]